MKRGLHLPADEIEKRVREIAGRITEDFAGRSPILIGVLRGSVMFLADLARQIAVPARFDFMSITSYGGGGSSGVVRIIKDLDLSIQNEHVILVEDIIDTGLTVTYLSSTLRARGPASFSICTLLDKSVRRIVEVPIRYRGFEIPDEFVIGYGLDYNGLYRNLRSIIGVADVNELAASEGDLRTLLADSSHGQT